MPTLRRAFALLAAIVAVAPHAIAQTVPPPSQSDETITLQPFEVSSTKGTRGYATTNAMGATRINTSIENTPQFVVSLNQEFLQDVNPASFMEALRFVSGVTKGSGGEYGGDVTLRGITTEAIGFRDGVPDRLSTSAAGLAVLPDPIEVERLEVIKGPAGILYGSHGFGGVINRVTKRPQETEHIELGADYTSYDDSEGFYRASVDATGPIDVSHKWLYRVIALKQDGTDHMHGPLNKDLVIGTLEFHPQPTTAVWARFRYGHDEVTALQDLWTDSARAMPFGYLPRNAFVGNYFNNDETDGTISKASEVGLTQSFNVLNSHWDARLLTRYNDVRGQRRTYIDSGSIFYRNGAPLMIGTAQMTTNNATWAQAVAAGYDDIRENILRRDIRNADSQQYSFNLDLTGRFNLGPTSHTLLIYVGRSKDETFGRRFRESWIAPKPSVFHQTKVPPESVLDGKPQTLAGEWNTTDMFGYDHAIQDNMSILRNHLIVVGGARYDDGTTEVFDNFANKELAPNQVTHWTPTYGVVAKPWQGVSLFGLHSETFQPQGGVNQAGDRLRPLIGNDNEFGVKLDLYHDRLVMTASHFNMTQENAFLKVIHPDGTFDFTQVPSSVTRGWEADLSAQPLDAVTLLAGYQWIEAKTQSGLSVPNVPQGGTYKGVIKYTQQAGGMKGASLGLTYEYVNNRRAGDTLNQFFIPGYQLYGAFAYVTWHRVRLQVNAENLTNKWYVAGSTSQQFMRSGAPRNIRFSAMYSF